MSDCPRGEVRDRLPDLIHGRLSDAERAEVERHVTTCAECAEELALLRSMRGALSHTPPVDVARITAAVRAAGHQAPSTVRPARRMLWRAAAIAAALLLGVLGYYVGAMKQRVIGPAQVAGIDTAAHTTPAPGPAPAPAPTTAPVPAPRVEVASTPRHDTARSPRPSPAAPSATQQLAGITFDGGVSDLSTADVQALLDDLDQIQAIPAEDPAPVIDAGGASDDGGTVL